MTPARPSAPRRPAVAGSAGLALACAALLLPAACGGGEPQPTGPKLSIVVIVDTLRRDALGCYGNESGASPHLDALARESVRFDRAISASGWTLPSVASILTATWPEIHKAVGKKSVLAPIADQVPVAAELFQQAGYATFGVANAPFLSPLLGLDRGFDVFDHEHATNHQIRRADETVDVALEWIRERAGEPAFVLIHVFDPHLDYDPLPNDRALFTELREDLGPTLTMGECLGLEADDGEGVPNEADQAYVRALYQAEVHFADAAIGRLVEALRADGIWDDTALFVTADHGEELWDHGGFEHGHTLYEELVHLPLLFKPPAGAGVAPGVVATQVRTLDVVPTLLELAGLPTPAQCDGASLLELARGGGEPDRIAFSQSTLYGSDQVALRTDRYVMILDLADKDAPTHELYDWRADPQEQRDLAAEQPELAERLAGELNRFTFALAQRAAKIPRPRFRDMSPKAIEEYVHSLEALGYVRGGDEDEREPAPHDGGDDEAPTDG